MKEIGAPIRYDRLRRATRVLALSVGMLAAAGCARQSYTAEKDPAEAQTTPSYAKKELVKFSGTEITVNIYGSVVDSPMVDCKKRPHDKVWYYLGNNPSDKDGTSSLLMGDAQIGDDNDTYSFRKGFFVEFFPHSSTLQIYATDPKANPEDYKINNNSAVLYSVGQAKMTQLTEVTHEIPGLRLTARYAKEFPAKTELPIGSGSANLDQPGIIVELECVPAAAEPGSSA